VRVFLALVFILSSVGTANAFQTEVDAGTMEQKRTAKIKWDKKQQRLQRLEEQRAAEAAAEAEEESDAPTVWTPPSTSGINWMAIAQCESGGNWSTNSTYDGGLQFHPDTWIAAGGGQYAPYAYEATPEQQIATAQRWVNMTGCVQCSSGWPNCGRFA
jgi:hypothetical protein